MANFGRDSLYVECQFLRIVSTVQIKFLCICKCCIKPGNCPLGKPKHRKDNGIKIGLSPIYIGYMRFFF